MIQLGQKVRDKVTGFEGIAIARTEWLNGCFRVVLQPPVDKDSKHHTSETFDEPQLEALSDVLHQPTPPKDSPIKLGNTVRETITGFEGVAVARTVWLSGLSRIVIQPPVDKEGKHREGHTGDESFIEVVGEKITEKERKRETGGPIPRVIQADDAAARA